jgi:hypothetical protein
MKRSKGRNDAWIKKALEKVLAFSKKHKGQLHLAETIRWGAESNGLGKPTDPRTWGAVMRRARIDGIVQHCGFHPAIDSHGCVKVLWLMNGEPTPKGETR